jgi:sulfite reductase (ferredoxin)
LGFVGNGPGLYQVWLGAAPNQTRLAQVYLEKLHVDDLETACEPIFVYFRRSRLSSETFGDFCDRVGLDAIRQFVATYVPGDFTTDSGDSGNGATKPPRVRHRVSVRPQLYTQLQAVAQQQGRKVSELVTEAIAAYLQTHAD